MSSPEVPTQDLLNAQTGQLGWSELARHFARGVVVCVDQEQDLVRIADLLVTDRKDEINELYEQGQLHRAQDEDAVRWNQDNSQFWAVVVAPWVLVQEL